jgi:hypothetical protein
VSLRRQRPALESARADAKKYRTEADTLRGQLAAARREGGTSTDTNADDQRSECATSASGSTALWCLGTASKDFGPPYLGRVQAAPTRVCVPQGSSAEVSDGKLAITVIARSSVATPFDTA